MKIAWFCIPAHGHTNPTLGLVAALVAAGHTVTYFSYDRFRPAIEATGAIFVSCDGPGLSMDARDEKSLSDQVGKDLALATELLVESTLALEEPLLAQLTALAPDLVVGDSMAPWAKLLARRLGLPFVCSNTTFAFNRVTARYMKQSPWAFIKLLLALPRINRQLDRLRARGYAIQSVLNLVQNDEATKTLVYTSAYFQPAADAFGPGYHFIGPSLRPVSQLHPKTRERTVYVSLGTVVHNEAFYRAVVDAFRDQTDTQVILALGFSERGDWLADLPDHIEVYERVDQLAVLRIADAFITHCGMNSTSEALYHEVPLVLCPQTPEQGAVATRVAELGAGLRLRRQSPAAIKIAVQAVIEDGRYRAGASRIARSFKASGGYDEAMDFLEEVARQGKLKKRRHQGRRFFVCGDF